jgi:hypothetical protein
MAQTKTKPKAKAATAKRAKPKSSKSNRSKATTRSKGKSRPKPSRTQAKAPSSNGKATNGRATLPLVAGGAALAGVAGVAGGVALGAAKSGSKVLGVRLPHPKRVQIRSKDLSKASKRVGKFGDQVGDLTDELRSLRRQVGDSSGGNSPLEILLKGLTERRRD